MNTEYRPNKLPNYRWKRGRGRSVCIAVMVILGAWGWYRGTLYWRVTSERARLVALGTPVTDADWKTWGQAESKASPLVVVWRFVIGQDDIQRMDKLTQHIEEVEGGDR
jgi:hypothetical protein